MKAAYSARATLADAAVLALCVGTAAGLSVALGQDANWDLQNYHYYNPWAWVQGRTFASDLGAAQVQTYHNPLTDLPFYAMVAAHWPPRAVAVALALPAAVAAFLLAKLAWVLLDDAPLAQRCAQTVFAVAVGATSAMGLGAIGSTMNEWIFAALLLAALFVLVRALVREGLLATRALLASGFLAGVAAGLKLTAAPYALALCVALLLRGPFTREAWGARIAESMRFAGGVLAGVAVAYGWWGATLWTHFGNPVFPYYNQLFRSPWWEPVQVPAPHAYGAHDLVGWLMLPFTLAEAPLFMVAEVPYRDGRIATVAALALLWLIVACWRRTHPVALARGARAGWRLVGTFAVAAFALWAFQFSIYRYLLVVDALTGLLLVGIVRALLASPTLRIAALGAAALALIGTTRIADWGRVPFGERWFEMKVETPRLEPRSLVLITTGEAVSYLIPLLPSDVRYIAALNTLVRPGQATELRRKVDRLIDEHRGGFYQLTYPLTEGQDVIAQYGLVRTSYCAVIVTNMPTSPLELCRLVRRAVP